MSLFENSEAILSIASLKFTPSSKSISRNPSLRKELFQTAMLGFALSEAMALFALMMAFLILYAF